MDCLLLCIEDTLASTYEANSSLLGKFSYTVIHRLLTKFIHLEDNRSSLAYILLNKLYKFKIICYDNLSLH